MSLDRHQTSLKDSRSLVVTVAFLIICKPKKSTIARIAKEYLVGEKMENDIRLRKQCCFFCKYMVECSDISINIYMKFLHQSATEAFTDCNSVGRFIYNELPTGGPDLPPELEARQEAMKESAMALLVEQGLNNIEWEDGFATSIAAGPEGVFRVNDAGNLQVYVDTLGSGDRYKSILRADQLGHGITFGDLIPSLMQSPRVMAALTAEDETPAIEPLPTGEDAADVVIEPLPTGENPEVAVDFSASLDLVAINDQLEAEDKISSVEHDALTNSYLLIFENGDRVTINANGIESEEDLVTALNAELGLDEPTYVPRTTFGGVELAEFWHESGDAMRPEAKTLQENLNILRAIDGLPAIAEDGKPGNGTQAAIRMARGIPEGQPITVADLESIGLDAEQAAEVVENRNRSYEAFAEQDENIYTPGAEHRSFDDVYAFYEAQFGTQITLGDFVIVNTETGEERAVPTGQGEKRYQPITRHRQFVDGQLQRQWDTHGQPFGRPTSAGRERDYLNGLLSSGTHHVELSDEALKRLTTPDEEGGTATVNQEFARWDAESMDGFSEIEIEGYDTVVGLIQEIKAQDPEAFEAIVGDLDPAQDWQEISRFLYLRSPDGYTVPIGTNGLIRCKWQIGLSQEPSPTQPTDPEVYYNGEPCGNAKMCPIITERNYHQFTTPSGTPITPPPNVEISVPGQGRRCTTDRECRGNRIWVRQRCWDAGTWGANQSTPNFVQTSESCSNGDGDGDGGGCGGCGAGSGAGSGEGTGGDGL